MKKFFTLTLALLMGCAVCYAQDDELDDTFSFVDAEGNVIADGSVIDVKGATGDEDLGEVVMKPAVYVKNNYSSVQGVNAVFTLSSIDNGQVQFCFPSVCQMLSTPTTINSGGSLAESETKDLQLEWFPTAYGKCSATVKLQLAEVGPFGNVTDILADGPTVTFNFEYNSESMNVSNVNVDNATEVSRYTVGGSQLSSPRKGINIVKMSDGSVKKLIVR